MRLNKKGISPLIATVLLIGFTIVLAALVFKWGGVLFKETTQSTGCESQGRISCTSTVSISLGAISFDDTTNQITKLIVNNAVSSKKIKNFNIQVESSDGTITTKAVDPGLDLEPGQSVNLGVTMNALLYQFTGLTSANIKAIHVIPTITQTTSDGNSCDIICEEQKTSKLSAQFTP
ncbi:MAG: archaellin/type IV pilin N-terminal domain-containing protein [Nanoarchaeota archaeon]